jgi:hypothetical protein
MALDLKDIKRLGLTDVGKVWVSRQAKKQGISEQEFVRRLVHESALKEFAEAKLLVALSVTHGLDLDSDGRKP